MKLTSNQKAARRAIRHAANEAIKELDARSYHRNGTQFVVHLHMDCVDDSRRINCPLHTQAVAKV